MKDIVVLYHKNCPDGFGSAFAAWKKFGDSATYIAMSHGAPVPEGLEGKEVYMIDYTFAKDTLLALEQKVKRLVALDHHISAKEAVESLHEHVWDIDRSGASIAWSYFHPDTPLPRLTAYIEDNDINRNALPNIEEVTAFISIQPFDFAVFDALMQTFESTDGFASVVERGRAYLEYADRVADYIAAKADEVEFDGHRVFAVNAQVTQMLRDKVGRKLYVGKQRPFAIVWNEDAHTRGFSMRGDGSVDLSVLAKKHAKVFGGGGHRGAASFRTPPDAPIPFTYIK